MSSRDRPETPAERRRAGSRLRRAVAALFNRDDVERDRRSWALGADRGAVELGDIDPATVALHLDDAMQWGGNPRGFYDIVMRMGGAGSVYRGSLITRANAILQIEPVVIPASADSADQAVAMAVEEDVLPMARRMAPDLLAATSHGASACEVEWITDIAPWKPVDYRWRDPRNFRAPVTSEPRLFMSDNDADLVIGSELGEELERGYGRWVIQHGHGGQGLPPFVQGVAPVCMLWWLAKIQARVRWSSFVQVYGHPMRIGRYDASHTDEDLRALQDVLINMGREVGGMMPLGMDVEIKDVPGRSTSGGGSGFFRDLIDAANRETEIEILGQVATTEGTPGRLGNEDAQDRVRRDVAEADAANLGQTVTHDLVEPYVFYRFGADVPVPEIQWILPERPEDLTAWSGAIATMVPLGLRVRTEDAYNRLRLGVPDDDDEVLEAVAPAAESTEDEPPDDEEDEDAEDQDDDDEEDDG